jgi:hypothetical protein
MRKGAHLPYIVILVTSIKLSRNILENSIVK